jgi:hypothetical protein
MKNKKYFLKTNNVGFVLSATLLMALAECVSSANGQGIGITITPPVVAVVPPVVQDNYVYYPSYGIYYNSGRHQYAYLQGGAWVNTPAPGGVSVDVLRASPSVNMDFHDSPANHHDAMVRQYPKNWKPSGVHQDKKENLKAGPPDNKGKQAGQPNVSLSANTIPTEVFANRSGSSIANTNAASTTVTTPASSLTVPANDVPDPPTNLRMVSGQ